MPWAMSDWLAWKPAPCGDSLRMEEGEDPLPPVVGVGDPEGERRDRRRGAADEPAQRQTRGEEEDDADHEEDHSRSEVGLDHHEDGEAAEDEGREEDRPDEVVEAVALLVEPVGEEDDEGDLRQLRGLHREEPEGEPAVRVVDPGLEEDGDEGEGRAADEDREDASLAPAAVVDAHRHEGEEETGDQGFGLAGDEEVGVAGVPRGRDDRRGAVDHDQPEEREAENGAEENAIGTKPSRHLRRSPARRPVSFALGRSS